MCWYWKAARTSRGHVLGIMTSIIICTVTFLVGFAVAGEIRPHALPTRMGAALLDLRIREMVVGREQRLALIATTVMDGSGQAVFNPFGDPGQGRTSCIVMTDAQHKVIHYLVKQTVPCSFVEADWVHARDGAIFGRCYWISPEPAQGTDVAHIPKLAAGRYSVYFLMSQRMFHPPPSSAKTPEQISDWTTRWDNPELDELSCASSPILLDVDAGGLIRPVSIADGDLTFRSLESDYTISREGVLKVGTRFINPQAAALLVPGLNLCSANRDPVHVSVEREDRQPFQMLTQPWLGAGFGPAMALNSLLVPEWGIVGGIESVPGTLPMPGRYQVTTELDDSIYTEKVFVNNKRTRSVDSKWPVAFRSRTTTITLLEKAP